MIPDKTKLFPIRISGIDLSEAVPSTNSLFEQYVNKLRISHN